VETQIADIEESSEQCLKDGFLGQHQKLEEVLVGLREHGDTLTARLISQGILSKESEKRKKKLKAKMKAAKKKEAEEASERERVEVNTEKENRKAQAREALEKAEADLIKVMQEEVPEEQGPMEEDGYTMEILDGDKLTLTIPVEVSEYTHSITQKTSDPFSTSPS